MKKIFTLFITVFVALSVNAQTETLAFAIDAYPWNYSVSASSDVTITGSSAWGEYSLTDLSSITVDDYSGITVRYSDAADNFQLKILGSMIKDGEEVTEAYVDLSSGQSEYTYDLSGVTGTITTLEAQAKEAGATITINSAVLVKSDGTEEALTFGGAVWGITVSPLTTPDISFTGQYGCLELVLASDGSSISYDPSTDADYNKVITVELEEALTGNLMIEFDNASGGIAWYNFYEGDATLTATLSTNDLTEAVVKVYLKAADSSGYPIAANIKSATITTSLATGISAVEVEDAADDAPIYNLQGQRVTKDTKGILIQNGKKFVNK